MQEEKRPLVGVGVGVVRNGMLLLGKRRGAHGEGEWSFPGGHLEFGESVEACAARELLEETGLQASLFSLGPWTEDLMEGKHYITLFVFVKEFIGEPRTLEPHKCERWEWFPRDALPEPLFSPIRSLIDKVGLDSLAYGTAGSPFP